MMPTRMENANKPRITNTEPMAEPYKAEGQDERVDPRLSAGPPGAPQFVGQNPVGRLLETIHDPLPQVEYFDDRRGRQRVRQPLDGAAQRALHAVAFPLERPHKPTVDPQSEQAQTDAQKRRPPIQQEHDDAAAQPGHRGHGRPDQLPAPGLLSRLHVVGQPGKRVSAVAALEPGQRHALEPVEHQFTQRASGPFHGAREYISSQRHRNEQHADPTTVNRMPRW